MQIILDFLQKIGHHTLNFALVVWFAIEKMYHKYIDPEIKKMKPACWVGSIFLILVGWILAKIF